MRSQVIQKYIQLLVLLLPIFNFAQKTFQTEVINPLLKEPLLFEKIYVHTNKTTYTIGEHIWFKIYVVNSENKPSNRTTRVSVDLRNKYGKIVQTRDIFIKNGIGNGQMILQNTLKPNNYFIQAYTNYMKNFGVSNAYVQKIKILKKGAKPHTITTNKIKYDVQLFPEGGYLLANNKNTIGIKVLVNGKGNLEYKGEIISVKNESIVKFKNEHLGMSKCAFLYKEQETYFAKIQMKDTVLKVKIPQAKKSGVAIHIDNKDEKNLILKWNSSNLQGNSVYTLLFHQRNKIIDFLQFKNKKNLNLSLEFLKEKFLNGVNTLTVFKGNIPILEREFFIEKTNNEVLVKLEKKNIENDSINYSLKLFNKNIKKLESELSISVLPIKSTKNKITTSIKTAYLLTPYITGYIENPAYYFNKKNKKRRIHLDLLMLTQGWTKYSLEEMLVKLNPKWKYNFDIGFIIKGEIAPIYASNLALLNTKNKLIDTVFLNGKKTFLFKNLKIYKGDTIKIAFIDRFNTLVKPKYLNIKKEPKSKVYFNNIKTTNTNTLKNNVESQIKNEDKKESIFANATQLLEVEVQGKNKKTNKYKDLVFDLGEYISIDFKNTYIDKEDGDLMDFLRFDRNIRIDYYEGQSYLKKNNNDGAILFIDGKKIHFALLNNINIKLGNIEKIMINSVRNNGKEIEYVQVFTNKNYKKGIEKLYRMYVITNGYDKIKQYYTPIYDFDTKINDKEIDWKPNIKTDINGKAVFKIKNHKKIKGYSFFIQGFSKDGLLIDKIIK